MFLFSFVSFKFPQVFSGNRYTAESPYLIKLAAIFLASRSVFT